MYIYIYIYICLGTAQEVVVAPCTTSLPRGVCRRGDHGKTGQTSATSGVPLASSYQTLAFFVYDALSRARAHFLSQPTLGRHSKSLPGCQVAHATLVCLVSCLNLNSASPAAPDTQVCGATSRGPRDSLVRYHETSRNGNFNGNGHDSCKAWIVCSLIALGHDLVHDATPEDTPIY